jgi:hypothetical protein
VSESASFKAGQQVVLFVPPKAGGKKVATKSHDKVTVANKKKPSNDTRLAKK